MSMEISKYHQVGQVALKMDYAIIEHFSKHLYSSPKKAIEEFVCNGFDAWASMVDVFLADRFGKDAVVIWDDGTSMDVEGIQQMWIVAHSPKRDNREINKDGKSRHTIGKFGIGKLASYSIGESITHICRQGDKFLAVSINFSDIERQLKRDPSKGEGETGREKDGNLETIADEPYKEFVYELTEEQALDIILSNFKEEPDDLQDLFDRSHWTYVVVSTLRPNVTIPSAKMLRYLLGFTMPLRPDFTIRVDGEAVEPLRGKTESAQEWDFSTLEVKNALTKTLESRSITPKFGVEVGLDVTNPSRSVPYVELPRLGKVWGMVRYFKRSLMRSRDSTIGRSYGVFVMVHQRLLNYDLDRLFLPDPSFGVFYKSQYFLYCDGLDDQILADRESFLRDSPKARELELVEKALYKVSVDAYGEEVKIQNEREANMHWLPTVSRDYFLSPIFTLLAHNNETPNFSLESPPVTVKTNSDEAPMCALSKDGFALNSSHPYVSATLQPFGGGMKGKEAMRLLQKIGVAEELFRGHLLDKGMSDEVVKSIMGWRDRLWREMGKTTRSDVEQLIKELEEASHLGKATFEKAIVAVLNSMGFLAERDGDSGKKDGFVFASCGDEQSYTFTFEAKGKEPEGGIPNDDAEVSAANAHRKACGADHAVIVARDFKGLKKDREDEPAILQECNCQHDGSEAVVVSIMTVECLSELLRVVHKFKFSLDLLRDVFTVVEKPDDKLNRIRGLSSTIESLDLPDMLRFIHEKQTFNGVDVPIRTVWTDFFGGRNKLSEEAVKLKCEGIETFSGGLFQIKDGNVRLRSSPELILKAISENALQLTGPLSEDYDQDPQGSLF